MKRNINGTALVIFAILLAACDGAAPAATTPPPPEPTQPPPEPTEVVLSGSVSEGGKAYDKWWVFAAKDEPVGDQPLWVTQSTNDRSGSDTWRCKECHGWDYLGADGAYGSGPHFTGFPGIFATAPNMTHAELLAVLNGTVNPDHDFSAMGEKSLANMVVFLSEGMVDMTSFVDPDTKVAVNGDVAKGSSLFEGSCSRCHGADGRRLNFNDSNNPEFVGTIAVDNPSEFIHAVRMGQASNRAMPSAIDSYWSMQDVTDVLAYAQSLPTGPPPAGSISNGGQAFDKWWVIAGVDAPVGDNPVWSRQDTNERSGDDTWRCKECHGWDYMGADGAYASGSHFTGFPAVFGARENSEEDLMALITGQIDPEHDFSVMGEDTLTDVVAFLKEGMLDVTPFIDPDTKETIGGDAANGEERYGLFCASCHGPDGRTINFNNQDDPEYVGTIAVDNPWEFIHKVRMGEPGSDPPMRAAIDSAWTIQEVIDVLTFSQSLPTDPP